MVQLYLLYFFLAVDSPCFEVSYLSLLDTFRCTIQGSILCSVARVMNNCNLNNCQVGSGQTVQENCKLFYKNLVLVFGKYYCLPVNLKFDKNNIWLKYVANQKDLCRVLFYSLVRKILYSRLIISKWKWNHTSFFVSLTCFSFVISADLTNETIARNEMEFDDEDDDDV